MSPVRPARRVLILSAAIVVLLWLPALLSARAARAGGFADTPPVDFRLSARAGANLHPSELTPARLPQTIERLDALAVRWVRFTLPWDAVEPERGRFDWVTWDAVIASFRARPDLQLVLVLDRSPGWARRDEERDNPYAPPAERADFGAFARAVAERYGAEVRYFQVWNEPNIAPHWGARPANPAEYVGLLREAAVNLRQADADAQVVLAALAPTLETGGANLSDVTYLAGIYASGGAAWFDAAAAQPYGFADPPAAPTDPAALNFARAGLLAGVMARNGDAATPLWAANWGWSAYVGESSPWAGVTPEQQAAYTRDALASVQRGAPAMGPLFWPALCPDLSAGDPLHGFSLCVGDDFTPAGAALAEAATPPGILPTGRHGMDHPALAYGAGWRMAGAAADPPQTQVGPAGDASAAAPAAEAPLTFTLYGSGLALEVQGGDYWAYLVASIDGAPAADLPRNEAGEAYLVLHDPAAARRIVSLARGLTPGEHTVTLTPVGGWGQWPVQGVIVTGAPAARLPGPAPLAALAALGTAAVVWAASRPRDGRVRRPGRSEPGARGAGLGETPVAAPLAALAGRVHALLRRIENLPPPLLWLAAAVLAVALYLSRSTVLDLALLLLLGGLFLAAPVTALPLIAAALPFWQQLKPLLRWEFGLFEVFAWVAVAAYLGRWLLGRAAGRTNRASRRGHILDWAVLALFAAGTLSALFAAEQGVAWREWRIVFLFGAALYWLVRWRPAIADEAAPVNRAWPSLVVAGLLAGSVIVSAIALYQLVTGNGRVDVEGVMRVRALYGSPNNLALVLGRAAPLALALALFGRSRRLLYAAVAALVLAACLATFSKGALLLGLPAGLAVVLVGGAWKRRRRWPLAVLAVAAILGLAGLILLFRTPRFAGLFDFQSGTSFFRIKLWQGALNMALDHPVLGVGPDNFLYAYRSRYVLPTAWQELNLSHPHNILLDLWTRIGLLGAAAGLWALGAGLIAAWQRFRNPAGRRWQLALGLLATLAVTVAHGLIDNSLFLPDLIGWFALALGLLASAEVWQDASVLNPDPQEE